MELGILIILFLLFFILIALRVPVVVSLAASSMFGILFAGVAPLNMVLQLYRGLDNFSILAVPFFLTVGTLSTFTSVGERLLHFATLLVGRVPGSIGHINIVVSMLFAGISGSANADASGIGSVMIPMMIKRGYSPSYSAAVTGISAVIGSIIPPSILMIIYGAFAGVSVGGLFLGGMIPGILMGFSYMAINYVYVRRHKVDIGGPSPSSRTVRLTKDNESWNETEVYSPEDKLGTNISPIRIILRAIPAMVVPLLIIVGIISGAFTATEAGMVALVYLIGLAAIYGEITIRKLLHILQYSVTFYSAVLLAAGAATLFGWVITMLGATQTVANVVNSVSLPAFGFLIMVLLIFLIIGTFLDGFPAIVIFAPIFLSGAEVLGIHPIQLGIVVVMTLALGLVTPPYGLVMLIVARLANISVAKATRAMLPFWAATITVIVLICAWPATCLWIPSLVFPELFSGR